MCTKGLPNHREVIIQFNDYLPMAGDFVEVRDDAEEGFIFVCKVVEPHIFNPHYADPRLVQEGLRHEIDSRLIVPSEGLYSYRMGLARILRDLRDGKPIFGGYVPKPGSEVHKLEPKHLKSLLGLDGNLRLGWLLRPEGVEFTPRLDTIFREHSVTCGVTRWGKSYANAVLMEEAVKAGKTVLVIDPHGEYGSFSEPNDVGADELPSGLKPRAFSTKIFSPPGFVGEGERELTIAFSDLEPPEIIELLQVSGENQIAVIYEAVSMLRNEGRRYGVDEFIKALEEARSELGVQAATRSIAARLRSLERHVKIFGSGVDPNDLVEEGAISVINLSGLDIMAQRIIVACVLRRLFNERKYGRVPEFAVFVDEAPRFVPQDGNPPSKPVIEELAREGLKFGISLHVIAQRPTELSTTVRDESVTKIFLKLTGRVELDFVRNTIGELAPELVDVVPNLNKGEAVIVGTCTSYIPVPIKFRPRQSKHAGTGYLKTRTQTQRHQTLSHFINC